MTVPMMDRRQDRRPWGLILVLAIAATAGLVSLPLQVSVLQATDSATAADVRRAQELTAQLVRQQAEDAAAAERFQADVRVLQLAICDQIEAVAAQAMLQVPPCPRLLRPTPQPTP